MAPKKKKVQKELTANEMRRLGMTEEDIARVIAERGKSAEERRNEADAAEARRREAEQRQRRLREVAQLLADLERAEGGPRVALRDEEEAERSQVEAEALRSLREVAARVAQRRVVEARRRRAEEEAAYRTTLEHLPPAEREAFIAAQIAEEEARCEAELAERERQEKKAERRLARERAARRAQQQRQQQQQDSEDLDDDCGGGSKKNRTAAGGRVLANVIDELEDALLSKYD